MLHVGITGGIGSGKTTVCRMFETLGVPVYYADDRAKALMTEDPALIKGIKAVFGAAAYFEDGTLNRQHIGNIAFSDKSKLGQLNRLVHPAVYSDSLQWFEQQNAPYALKEAALHFESGGYKLMDKMITVFAPKALRIERVMQRDKVEQAAVEARIKQQMPDEQKIKLADFIIYNDGSKPLIQQVYTLHDTLMNIEKSF